MPSTLYRRLFPRFFSSSRLVMDQHKTMQAEPQEETGMLGIDGVAEEKRGTQFDQEDMLRMGKLQQLRRNFRFVSIFGFIMVLMATWETMLVSND